MGNQEQIKRGVWCYKLYNYLLKLSAVIRVENNTCRMVPVSDDDGNFRRQTSDSGHGLKHENCNK